MKPLRIFRKENADLAASRTQSSRMITVIVGLPAILALIFLGKTVFLLGTLVIFIACVAEFTNLLRLKNEVNLLDVVFGVSYISLILSLNLIYAFPKGKTLLLFVFLGTWAFDTAAFYIGSKWGEHKIATRISPNKSFEGLLGGIAAVLIVAIFLTSNTFGTFITPYVKLVWAFSLAFAAILGDLIESALKRIVGVKDSSGVLLGHGGFLDRFDSLILTAPVSYLIFIWLL